MKVKAITFDCAGTIVRVNYNPVLLALDCARDCGLQLDEAGAGSRYQRLLQTRWTHYLGLNKLGNEADCDGFWQEITDDWLDQIGVDRSYTQPILEAARTRLYGPESPVFQLFEDTLPCLDSAVAQGLRIAVLSNWDYSLIRVLKSLGIDSRFELIVASLLKGVEKPDPKLFHIASSGLGLEPEEIVHVGDCPNDDILGAQLSGFRSVHIDRDEANPRLGQINSLSCLIDAIRSIECS